MDAATAQARLERMTQANEWPGLTEDELLELLELAKRPDLAGVAPGAPGWSGVYDLNAAAAEGWRWQAGKCAGDETVSADGTSLAADAHKACLAMAAVYDKAPTYDPQGATGSSYGELGTVSQFRRRYVDPDRLNQLAPGQVANLPEFP